MEGLHKTTKDNEQWGMECKSKCNKKVCDLTDLNPKVSGDEFILKLLTRVDCYQDLF